MLKSPFEIKKDLSINNALKISLCLEELKNKTTNVVDLKVILLISYHKESLEFFLRASTKKDEKTKKIEFNMVDVLKTIFENLIKDFNNEYFLSYYMNNEEENKMENNNGIKTFNYFGKINQDMIYQNNNIFFILPKDKTIYLKLWQKIKREMLFDPLIFEENEMEYSNPLFNDINLDEEEENKTEKGSGRDKEKTIGYAIIKVCKWEKLREKSKNNITLEDAAKKIDMAKKTLDDYKAQIKKGKEKDFNFNKHYKCKMNVLKDHNRDQKKSE